MGAAQVQSQLRYLKTTTAAPRRRGRDRRRSDRAAGIAIAARTHGARARAPARLLAHVWLHPSSLQAFALLSARCAARRAHCGADIAAVDAGCAAADAPASPLIAAIRTVHRDTSSTLPISSLCRPPHGCSVPLFSSSAGVCLCTVAGAPSCGARAVWLCVVPRRDSRAPKPLGGVLVFQCIDRMVALCRAREGDLDSVEGMAAAFREHARSLGFAVEEAQVSMLEGRGALRGQSEQRRLAN